MRSAGNGPQRPHATQRTGDGVCLLYSSTIPAELTLWPSGAFANNLGFAGLLEQQWIVAGTGGPSPSPLASGFYLWKKILGFMTFGLQRHRSIYREGTESQPHLQVCPYF